VFCCIIWQPLYINKLICVKNHYFQRNLLWTICTVFADSVFIFFWIQKDVQDVPGVENYFILFIPMFCLNLCCECWVRTEYIVPCDWFVGAMGNCENGVPASSCPSVRPRGTTRLPRDGFSWNVTFEYFFENQSRNIKRHWHLTRWTDTAREDPCTFMTVSRWILLRMRSLSDKSCRENQKQTFYVQ
jgi:hypothetical protein